MAKLEKPKIVTKKHMARQEREDRQTRLLIYASVSILAIVVILVGIALVDALIITPNKPVATVNGEEITTSDYQAQVKFERLQLVNQFASTLQFMQSFDDESIQDPRIWEVIDKIKGEASEEFEKMFPAKQPSRVTITLNDGKEFSLYLEYPKGDPREPMTEADLDAKVEALCGDRFDAKLLKKTVMACEEMSAQGFMKAI